VYVFYKWTAVLLFEFKPGNKDLLLNLKSCCAEAVIEHGDHSIRDIATDDQHQILVRFLLGNTCHFAFGALQGKCGLEIVAVELAMGTDLI
jgi:hypothetical protein